MKMKLLLPIAASVLALTACTNDTEPPSAAADPSTRSAEIAPAPTVKNVTPDEAADLLAKNENIVVLDVRSPEEFASGHIAGAKNVDFRGDDFEGKLAELDKSQAYLVHCASGGRSSSTREKMKGLNFETIYHLEGGLRAWEKAGKPVER